MSNIAKVIVDVGLDREFDYRIPPPMRDEIVPGTLVEVPFGHRYARGYVIALSETTDQTQLKDIQRRVGDKPLVREPILELAKWMAAYYMAPIEHAVRAVLPSPVRKAGAKFKERLYVAPEHTASDPAAREALRGKSPRQADVLDVLVNEGELYLQDLVGKAGTTAVTVRKLEAQGFLRIGRRMDLRNPCAGHALIPTHPLSLMPEQGDALGMVRRAVDTLDPSVVLLYGVTGSGKTEVYLQGIQHVLDRGRGAIVLVPEISLTPQTVERFRGRFGERIAVLHSSLSSGERHDEWHRVHDGKATIVIGARSALFAPVKDLGLIVVDEEHEPSYKQEESPRYHARDVAVMRGRFEKCAVVLGTATPALESMYNADKGKYAVAELRHRVDHKRMPAIRVVDMRAEKEREGRVNVISRDLLLAMEDRLERKEQIILFLNRRGFFTSLTCPTCGYVATCTQCSVSMTYHKRQNELCCHICGHREGVPSACPKADCRDPEYRFAGTGTQRVEEIVSKIFPRATLRRMDSDSTTRKGAHGRILDDFRSGKIDILVGTQMIAKGLHFPNVTLVGVIHADAGLHLPDFRAGERTFQLLTQVAGRAGRGDVMGEVFVQTYTPFHPAIQAARRLDFAGMYDQEIEFRRELMYPPFAHLVCVTFHGTSESLAKRTAETVLRQVQPLLDDRTLCSEVAPAPLARAKGRYRFQIILRSPTTRAITRPVRHVLRECKMPRDVQCTVDVDAQSML